MTLLVNPRYPVQVRITDPDGRVSVWSHHKESGQHARRCLREAQRLAPDSTSVLVDTRILTDPYAEDWRARFIREEKEAKTP